MVWPEDVLSIVLATVLGAGIGLERQLSGKPAGLRTNLLICLGAAVFTILSREMASGTQASATRIAAGIVTGVGFLGAGAIIQDRAGDYWKTVLLTSNGFDGPNKEMRYVQGPMYIAIDDRYDHATVLRALTPKSIGIWFAVQNPNIYSLGGFQKLCK